MTIHHQLASLLAQRVPEMARDSAVNNEALIASLIDQELIERRGCPECAQWKEQAGEQRGLKLAAQRECQAMRAQLQAFLDRCTPEQLREELALREAQDRRMTARAAMEL